ncbi:hypothetical protein AMS68_000520 [Peltaster fructicola]|uniref:FAD-binding domain-containing protein n=1 Tax=Peltaster fructicola TaxID=286661 RepID=A0A6H0XJU2_9PEZI|nr:hypothetical protein AMS68_000520 [Peltaster fructicola]
MATEEILIVGAGPSGMIAAMSLRQIGVKFRIIDASNGPGTQSRAMGVQARTLELYRTFGIAEELAEGGIHSIDAQIRTTGFFGNHPFPIATMPFSKVGHGISKFPFVLNYPQDQHERLLARQLKQAGVKVDRSTELTALYEDADGVHVTLTGPDGEEKATYRYVVGADGAHSRVRHAIDVGFSGGTYTQSFYVADLELTDDQKKGQFVVTVSGGGVCARMPVRTGQTRVVGVLPASVKNVADLKFSDVQASAEPLLSAKVEEVNWFSHYNVHHRVADHFRIGSVFLVGDACHLHSPLGGQGMNTGIGDAYNLAWKLGHVVQGRANEGLLSSYELERRPFAEALVATTDAVFSNVISNTTIGYLIRVLLWPLTFAIMTKWAFARNKAFRFISQIHISYAKSPISDGQVGQVKAGDRLPWVDYGDDDNHASFDGVNWQLLIHGDASIELLELKWIELQRFPFTKRARQVGIKENAVYLVRPDTYTALVMERFDLDTLRRYVKRLGLSA